MIKKAFTLMTVMVLSLFAVSVVSATSISPGSCAALKTAIESGLGGCAGSYELGIDIDCAGETGLTPICSTGLGFGGVFDGKGHTITGLTISLPTTSDVGLFAKGDFATIKNIGLVGVNITGSNNVGGLVGSGFFTIRNSFVTGKVSGTGIVGGLAGSSELVIENSYASVDVKGGSAGGLVGRNGDEIKKSYAIGSVSGSGFFVGGLVGETLAGAQSIVDSFSAASVSGPGLVGGLTGDLGEDGFIINSFWDTTLSGVSNMCGAVSGTGCDDMKGISTSSYFFDKSNAPMSVWDFTITPIWDSFCDESYYPSLKFQGLTSISQCPGATCAELRRTIEADCTANYQLTSDLDCTGETGLVPICSTFGDPFTGTFDGQGNTITGFSVSSSGNVGLFGLLKGVVKNLDLVSASVTGTGNVGGLVGLSFEGSVVNSSVSGSVSNTGTGIGTVGGLVGDNAGTIDSSFSTADVTATGSLTLTGGVAGEHDGVVISNSYATGDVTGIKRVGGLVGVMSEASFINNTYATGKVVGDDLVGGLVGDLFNDSDTGGASEILANSFSIGDVSSATKEGGLVGGRDSTAIIINSFYNNVSGNPDVCVGAGAQTGCTAIQNNITHFFEAAPLVNQPVAGWPFPPWATINDDVNVPPLGVQGLTSPVPFAKTAQEIKKQAFDAYVALEPVLLQNGSEIGSGEYLDVISQYFVPALLGIVNDNFLFKTDTSLIVNGTPTDVKKGSVVYDNQNNIIERLEEFKGKKINGALISTLAVASDLDDIESLIVDDSRLLAATLLESESQLDSCSDEEFAALTECTKGLDFLAAGDAPGLSNAERVNTYKKAWEQGVKTLELNQVEGEVASITGAAVNGQSPNNLMFIVAIIALIVGLVIGLAVRRK